MKTAIASEGIKSSPAVAVTGFAFASGWGVNELVALLTGAYVVIQIAYLAWKWRKEYKASRP